ncbi:hypothetical protein [Dolichospermum sp. LEGE 00246]|uniref:hypothetical protein n=1 Tax=Dolichospermum sp. LEGE 00246 TaxID=1828605 RepID=UPI00187E4BAB|nr:hypothetical protein [Dolichospermum sp. LEGE 00246]MBE9256559.1 hypothetical protein [Dolichospermum sp. LEGE 00246]
MRSHSLNLLTAIALLQLPQTAIPTERFAIAPFNPPNSELTSQRLRYRTPSTPQTANCLQQRLRYRIPPTPQTANCLQQRLRYRTPPTSQTAIASLQIPKQRSHPLNSPNSDRTLSTSQYPFLTNHEEAKSAKLRKKRREIKTLFYQFSSY